MDTDAVKDAAVAGAGAGGVSALALGVDFHQMLGVALGVVLVYALRRAEQWMTSASVPPASSKGA